MIASPALGLAIDLVPDCNGWEVFGNDARKTRQQDKSKRRNLRKLGVTIKRVSPSIPLQVV